MAISHQRIAEYLQWSDPVDPDPNLSAAERRVLEAVLTGGDLEAALAALSASYANSCKNGIRPRTTFFNEGDIRVDVTGGTIVSDGDGVHARYALTNDRNGAIAVTVAEDARVSDERNGIYVGGAGAEEENFRAQSVTVNGAVMGGTGAGVHMAGGGQLVVGKTGRIGATSGVGVLADGPGDFHAAVSGTVHDPAGPLTVAGSIGRLLYTSGATVTVAATGARDHGGRLALKLQFRAGAFEVVRHGLGT